MMFSMLREGWYLFYVRVHWLKIIQPVIYVWIYETGAKELKSRLKATIYKLKEKSVLFFLPLPVYLPFIGFLSLFFARLLRLEVA